MNEDLTQIENYCKSLAAEFVAKKDRIRTFVPQNEISGDENEDTLRTFLAEHTAKRLTVAQGFVVDVLSTKPQSRQCDILVFDERYPVIHSAQQVKIVMPESVKLVLEIKTTLNKGALEDAFAQIASVRELSWLIPGAVFGFGGTQSKTLLKNLKALCTNLVPARAPKAIFGLESGFVAYREGTAEVDKASFAAYKLPDQTSVLTTFFLFYLDVQMLPLAGGSTVANALRKHLDRYSLVSEIQLTGPC